MCYPGIAAMERYWHNRNWSYICVYYHSRQGGLGNKISWWISIVLSWKPTKTSAVFDRQLTVLIRNQILQNIPAVMKYRISVTRIILESNKVHRRMCLLTYQLNPCSISYWGDDVTIYQLVITTSFHFSLLSLIARHITIVTPESNSTSI